jgi:hypothetical protein
VDTMHERKTQNEWLVWWSNCLPGGLVLWGIVWNVDLAQLDFIKSQ